MRVTGPVLKAPMSVDTPVNKFQVSERPTTESCLPEEEARTYLPILFSRKEQSCDQPHQQEHLSRRQNHEDRGTLQNYLLVKGVTEASSFGWGVLWSPDLSTLGETVTSAKWKREMLQQESRSHHSYSASNPNSMPPRFSEDCLGSLHRFPFSSNQARLYSGMCSQKTWPSLWIRGLT